MKISGKDVAEAILGRLAKEIKSKNLHPTLTIILAGNNPASRIYVKHKIKAAQEIGIEAKLYEFSQNQKNQCLKTIEKLNDDPSLDGIIIQYPLYENWNFEDFISKINSQKDVDGFLPNSPFSGATALGVLEMLGAFARHEGFKNAKDFLKDKKIVILGKGKTAGGPIRKLLTDKGLKYIPIDSKTEDPDKLIKDADVVISATGRKNIINGGNIKKGSYVIGVGVGKEIIDDKEKIYGDINEGEVSQKAKLYCPTIGGIGPLTVACLLKNVVESANRSQN